MTSGERINVFDAETVEKIEANIAEKSYPELANELGTNREALIHTTEQITEVTHELERLIAQKSLLQARREALEHALRVARDKGLE